MGNLLAESLILLLCFIYYAIFGGWLDVALFVGFSLWKRGSQLLVLADHERLWLAALALPGIAASFIIFLAIKAILITLDAPIWNRPGKPLLIPCRTTHRRIFPEKHAFSYSYLTVGIPVGWAGTVGAMVSADVRPSSGIRSLFSLRPILRKGWFDVDPSDYLSREGPHISLRGKLDEYLKSQGANPLDYPHAYLVTAARFLGYHFNPVSFWYLYSDRRTLEAMILEVNNTFDERRMYFLTRQELPPERHIASRPSPVHASLGAETADGTECMNISAANLKQSWPKDFHVSPFNSRKGSYSLLANDPLAPGMRGECHVETTINLKSSKGHPKMVARLFSEGTPVDPATMTAIQKLIFLLRWWWVGFVTFPRIVKEAATLFFFRDLHIWFKPMPRKDTVGRRATRTERELETVFRSYLRHLVEQAPVAVVVKYVPSGIDGAVTELMTSPEAKAPSARAEEMEFKVLTPEFYIRFVYYAHDMEALFCEFRENCTIWVSRPDLLPKLVLKKPLPPLKTSNMADFVRFKTIQKLRRPPERIVRPLMSSDAPASRLRQPTDLREFRISPMDGFILSLKDFQTRQTYRSLVARAFISDRISLGSFELLGLQEFALHAYVAWILSRLLGAWVIDMLP